jgi:hypothetical protein
MVHFPIARLDLVLASAALATFLLAGGLPATDYGVSAHKGSDTNPGTLAQPFKTLTKATSVAKSGDRIFVFPGRYSPTLGEKYPITFVSGVKVLGVNARSCIIDAEFKTNVTNPKDPKVNPVQGTVVKIGANCEFSRMSIINAPRDPKKPGNYWWNIALHIDGGGNSDGAHVHHCQLDEFSRGIFVGGPSGNHSFKNVRIDNCVLSRFYVEAINATVNAGSASGNRIFHCTIIGHRDPTTNKNYPRACISFGTAAQFDVRNCIIKNSGWAGLEAVTGTSITSDYNCYHGSPVVVSGVKKGTNDIEKDPGLAFAPTTTATVDPHSSGPRGPLWEKGTNIVTTGSDIDANSSRLSGTRVDIGADEFTGADTWFVGVPRIGSTSFHIGVLSTPSNAVLFALGLGTIAPISLPGISGKFELDLTLPHVFLRLTTDANGFARLQVPVPNDARLIGLEAFIQCLDTFNPALSDLDRIAFVR